MFLKKYKEGHFQLRACETINEEQRESFAIFFVAEETGMHAFIQESEIN